jgi:hypothetical protein
LVLVVFFTFLVGARERIHRMLPRAHE